MTGKKKNVGWESFFLLYKYAYFSGLALKLENYSDMLLRVKFPFSRVSQ